MSRFQKINSLNEFDLKYEYDFSKVNMIINPGKGAGIAMKINIQDGFYGGTDKILFIYNNGFIVYYEFGHEDSGALKSTYARTNLKLKRVSKDENIFEPQLPEQN
ncbi:hypothetical protein [Companilactobacillus nantensis]|uniref:Uncharacterized protein n=1 Tax=Companilactobacillus nantensis DSM 16982 TaxID=1423774 RepID=A0A0R1WI70_9LACO|nr:hypothetical protein [Companilactobacillus nantensis]KRM17293.1 hypothetical protein FD31_GL000372 [Companilactobacillus nantensis DSM 16982]GEO63975.1 hypothetical protein LNA01_11580 [Companilactobacillus nantensis]